MNSSKHGILVTGTHRSGTTWMGRILSIPENVVYIHEPFNREYSVESIPYRFERWFAFTEDVGNRQALYQALTTALEFRHIPDPPPGTGRIRALRRNLRRRVWNLDNRLHRRLPLVKDPLALLSADDLAARFNLDVVCMIRHPLAFCGSLKKWDWRFPFGDFLAQPRLMERHFREERERIECYAREEQPVLRQAVLLWNLLHKVIRGYQMDHPDWMFPRHEDMVADPVQRFREMFQKLGLDFTDSVAAELHDSLTQGSGETSALTYRSRDASTVTRTWKSRLGPDEIDYVLHETSKLRMHFYPEDQPVENAAAG